MIDRGEQRLRWLWRVQQHYGRNWHLMTSQQIARELRMMSWRRALG